MGLNAKNAPGGGGRRQPELEPGAYPGRLVSVIALGLQPQPDYQGQKKDPCYEINLTYELADEYMLDAEGNPDPTKPRWISETIPFRNLSQEKAKSTLRYNVLDPKQEFGGDWAKLVGAPCLITLVNNPGRGKNAGKVFTNVGGISPMRAKDAEKLKPLVNEFRVFDIEDPNMEVFESLPDFLKEKIKSNLEFNGSKLQGMLGITTNNEPEEESSEVPDGNY